MNSSRIFEIAPLLGAVRNGFEQAPEQLQKAQDACTAMNSFREEQLRLENQWLRARIEAIWRRNKHERECQCGLCQSLRS